MTKSKSLGIWMNYSNAHLIEPAVAETTSILSECKTTGTEHRSETVTTGDAKTILPNPQSGSVTTPVHTNEQTAYYKKIADAIKGYDQVVLFGSSDAKTALLNVIKADASLSKIKVESKQTDKMNDTEQHTFVKDYFAKHAN